MTVWTDMACRSLCRSSIVSLRSDPKRRRVVALVALAALSLTALAVMAGCGSDAESRVVEITSSNMEPTLHCAAGPGCRANVSDVVVVRDAEEIDRGDILALQAPPGARVKCGWSGEFLARVIALPGERWEERAGRVYVNGSLLREGYVLDALRDAGSYIAHAAIGDGFYFVMGDNRSMSCDSREWGPIPRELVLGEVDSILRGGQRVEVTG